MLSRRFLTVASIFCTCIVLMKIDYYNLERMILIGGGI